jgi:hypothetical protein
VKQAKKDLGMPLEGPGAFAAPKKGTALYSLAKKIYTREYNTLGSFPV